MCDNTKLLFHVMETKMFRNIPCLAVCPYFLFHKLRSLTSMLWGPLRPTNKLQHPAGILMCQSQKETHCSINSVLSVHVTWVYQHAWVHHKFKSNLKLYQWFKNIALWSGVWQMVEFCTTVKLARGGSVTNTVLPCLV